MFRPLSRNQEMDRQEFDSKYDRPSRPAGSFVEMDVPQGPGVVYGGKQHTSGEFGSYGAAHSNPSVGPYSSYPQNPSSGGSYQQARSLPPTARGNSSFAPNQQFTANSSPNARSDVGEQLSEKLHLSPEDYRTLRECNRTAFWSRCVPFMTVGCTAVYYLTMQAKPPQHKWYAYLSLAMGGWMLGKWSYANTCLKKIAMSNSTSDFANRARTRLNIKHAAAVGSIPMPEESEFALDDTARDPLFGKTEFERESFGAFGGAADWRHQGGRDANLAPGKSSPNSQNWDGSVAELHDPSAGLTGGGNFGSLQREVTYDELRARNRASAMPQPRSTSL